MSNALSSWTNRVIELRARALTVTQDRNTRMMQTAFSHWLSKSRQNIENLSLVDSFIEVQEEELLRNRFRKWHASAKKKGYLRDLLQRKLEDDERNLVAGVFDRWVDVYKERQLIDQVGVFCAHSLGGAIMQRYADGQLRGTQEMDIVRYRTYQSLGSSLQKWKTRTMVRLVVCSLLYYLDADWNYGVQTLPAIRFDAQRQRRRFFSIWRDRLPARMDENQAVEHDRLRLLRK